MGAGERHANQENTRSKATWPLAQGSCTLDRAQSCATRRSQHTTPHHTRPHHIAHDTTPRFAGFAARRQGQRLPQRLLLARVVCERHHPTPAAAVLCRGRRFSIPSTNTRAFLCGRGLGRGGRPWFGRRSAVSRLAAVNLHQRCMSLFLTVHIYCVRMHALVPRTCISVRGPFLLKRTGRYHQTPHVQGAEAGSAPLVRPGGYIPCYCICRNQLRSAWLFDTLLADMS